MSLDELSLPVDLVADIVAWNERYQQVIPAGIGARRSNPMASLIRDLGEAGLLFANRIVQALSGAAKVKYFSEGLLRAIS